jgi:regulator of protease activity HflC (stomatin/prohibitin superfamily)
MPTKRKSRRLRGKQNERRVESLRAQCRNLSSRLQRREYAASAHLRQEASKQAEVMLEKIFARFHADMRNEFCAAAAREAGERLGEQVGAHLNRHFRENEPLYAAKKKVRDATLNAVMSGLDMRAQILEHDEMFATIRFRLPPLEFNYRF